MKRLKIALGLFIVLAICAVGFTACNATEIDNLKETGKIITVTYDSNGGKLLKRDGVSIVDMFDPDDFTADGNGNVSIKLLDPTDARRSQNNLLERVTISKTGYFLSGWYQERTLKVNADGKPLSEDDREIEADYEGYYHYKYPQQGEKDVTVNPVYYYDKLWDFDTDVLTYAKGSGEMDITLYAGWVEDFKFEFYSVDDDGKTNLESSYTFDYLEAVENESSKADSITLPSYTDENGNPSAAMNYSLRNGSSTSFPKLSGKTFYKAYADAACTVEITDDVVMHGGSVDYETAAAVNPVKKIYIKYIEGERYKISTAQELIDNAKANGWYELANELDFTITDGLAVTQLEWPKTFSAGTFTGKIYTKTGASVKIKNVKAVQTSESVYGGLFGNIAKTAEIKDVTFDNVVFDMAKGSKRNTNGFFGTFAGYIETGATISNVKLLNATLRIGAITPITAINSRYQYSVNLIANGTVAGITADISAIKLQIYGIKEAATYTDYSFSVKEETVARNNEDGTVTFETQYLKRENGKNEVYDK